MRHACEHQYLKHKIYAYMLIMLVFTFYKNLYRENTHSGRNIILESAQNETTIKPQHCAEKNDFFHSLNVVILCKKDIFVFS